MCKNYVRKKIVELPKYKMCAALPKKKKYIYIYILFWKRLPSGRRDRARVYVLYKYNKREMREKNVKKKHTRYIYYVPKDSMFGSSAINNCTHARHRTTLVYK